MKTQEYIEVNKKFWNERVSIHKKSELYELESFKKGKNKLNTLERKELGNVKDKTILHLQCHFGMDTLSLAMLGAKATGIDFSEDAIKEAKSLNKELGLDAEFILSDIKSLPEKLDKKFDIVFTSYGVLTWLPDLNKWAGVVNYFLKDDGFFYIAEIHPASIIFEDGKGVKELKVKYPYFRQAIPLEFVVNGSYADSEARTKNNKTYEWLYSLMDVFSSLLNAGLSIEFFHEFPFTVYPQFPFMKRGRDGYWRLKKEIPLLFSIKAVRNIQ
ncbi:MAG: class I SAM-dependent methyltransferase [Ignavibacteria bacterium]|nr:class I SAM-dependent methyltransferase [Ignavibacteria bacterium]